MADMRTGDIPNFLRFCEIACHLSGLTIQIYNECRKIHEGKLFGSHANKFCALPYTSSGAISSIQEWARQGHTLFIHGLHTA